MNWNNNFGIGNDYEVIQHNALQQFSDFENIQNFNNHAGYDGIGAGYGFGVVGFDPIQNFRLGKGMDMGMNMDMGMALDMGMGMGLGNGLGMDMVCGDQFQMIGHEQCMKCCDCECDCCEEEFVRINFDYICPLGFLRLGIILLLFGGSLAAWILPWDNTLFYSMNGSFGSTREGYLVIAGIGMGTSVVIFVAGLFNFPNLPGLSPLAWLIIVNLLDTFIMLALLCISITACVREAQIVSFDYIDVFHQGAFAAAGTLGLLATFFYIGHIALSIPLFLLYF